MRGHDDEVRANAIGRLDDLERRVAAADLHHYPHPTREKPPGQPVEIGPGRLLLDFQ